MNSVPDAAFKMTPSADGVVTLVGSLDITQAASAAQQLDSLSRIDTGSALSWDLRALKRIDATGALLLSAVWQQRAPAKILANPTQRSLLARVADAAAAGALDHSPDAGRIVRLDWARGLPGLLADLITVLGRLLIDLGSSLTRPRTFPWLEFSAAAYRSGVSALPVVMIVGFLIGIVLSYLSSLQLREFGAESFLPLILGVGVTRELGPLLTAIVVAGRSGSAVTAGIAAMRLTQELDALSALGISHSRRLVMPKTLALALTLPILVVCTNLAALAGGMLAGWVELNSSPRSFLFGLQRDVALVHFTIGLFKSVVFGLAIGVVASTYGLRARANTQSLAAQTTRSVVVAISAIILLDAFFAIVFKETGG